MKTHFFKAWSYILLISLLGCISTAHSQVSESQFDKMIEENYPADEPGATILIAKDGEKVYHKAFGTANLELEVPMKTGMVFEIGSITKQFTAVSILMLMEEGKLSLEDDITKYIEDYPTHGHTITIHHLLTHTSGIKSVTSMEEWSKVWRKDYEPKELIEFFKYEPMDFAPGEKYQYNNSAYIMLGYIIEKVSGMTYPEFLEKRIFNPLGMTQSYYGSQKEIIPKRASGYQNKENEWYNAEYLSMTQPYSAGSIMSTVEDLFTWHKALQNNTLVKEETIQKAFTNYKLNNGEPIHYGYGWSLNEIDGSRTIEHGGGIFGYTTNAIYLPEEDVYVVMFTNRDDKSPGMISTKIAAEVIGKPYKDKEDRIELDEDYMKSLTGVYEFEDGTTRYIIFEEGQLYSQRKGSRRFRIFPFEKHKFIFEGSLANYEFEPTQNGITLIFKNRRDESIGKKTDQAIPEKEEKKVDEAILKQYTGEYELQPNFSITITLEDKKLMARATGQDKFQIFPESDTKFFYKVVDAQIEFVANEQGEYDTLILYQAGQELKGHKKD